MLKYRNVSEKEQLCFRYIFYGQEKKKTVVQVLVLESLFSFARISDENESVI